MFFPCLSLPAQHKTIPGDSSQVTVRSIPTARINKYKNDEAFNYNQQRAKGISMWDRFWYWVGEMIQKASASKFWSGFFKLLLWGFCIFAFVYTVLKFRGMEGIGLFSSNKNNDALEYLVTEEDIYGIDFPGAIQAAIEQKSFRPAIRLLYLQTLRKLSDAELIRWKMNKTNDIYVSELFNTVYYKDFAYLTRAYDYAWYGELPVHEEQFKEVQHYFQIFQQQLAA
jgi:Domain of unknown function (DUF4129)